ncbi:putative serine-threonine protein kinase, plant-type [Corchorus capsularis]|uniref:Putative serine-threonine protein kinase, plant-type n=1 Tax=Corchorus capsularis TaxID=210143 RepID=A0A1R3HUK3_COCAP|nr:putative serine-threonine protein kinase, plant-type [Corchorus capsularis]
MGNSTFFISLLFFPFLLSQVLCQDTDSPLPAPTPPPLAVSTQRLIFKDRRLAVVYPIIQAFKKTITVDPLNKTGNWVGSDICSYSGFYCDNPPDNVSANALAGIDFNGFLLEAPTLEGFIDKLPDLAIFHANSNKFSGSLPDVSTLPYFYELDISNNDFSGAFPATVLNIKELSFLDIRFNSFQGTVPPQIWDQALEVLFINNNDFATQLPENFGSTRVRYLTLANNKLTGPIPQSIRNLNSTLVEVLLLNNKLSGCLPYEIGYLKELKLFDVESNLLTGPLPCSVSCLEKVELLNFANNLFYWEVPEEICALGNLVNLSLADNYFTKVGPICRKLIKNGVLDVRQNCIHDLPDQKSLLECAEFYLKYIRFCPPPATNKIIPCKPNAPSHDHNWPRSKKAPLTYKTLERHKS